MSVTFGSWWRSRKRISVSVVHGSRKRTGISTIRVLIFDSAFSAAASIRFSSASMSSGAITSGSNLTWKEALAGQISVTPLICASRTAVVIDRLLKKASSDIASSTSTKTCSSAPKEYLFCIVAFASCHFSLAALVSSHVSSQPVWNAAARTASSSASATWSGSRRLHPADFELVQRALEPRDGVSAVLAPDDQLAEERVVEGRDLVARIEHGVEADARTAGHRGDRRPCRGMA